MDERQTPNTSFRSARNVSRPSPLNVRSERSPLHDVRQHAHANDAWTRRIACANSFSRTSTQSPSLKLGEQPRFEVWLANRSGTTREGWWSQTESNRRPPACKAGALPTELWPRIAAPAKREWWAWEDLNFRPHAYQARALTN